MIGFVVVVGIFIVIPLVVFLIVRKILSDRHRERMAMIENGLTHKYRNTTASAEESNPQPPHVEPADVRSAAPAGQTPPKTDYYRRDKAEDSTVKWMYIFAGAAVGLLIASVVTNLLFTYTLIETRGLGLSIVVLSVCVALYLYYERKNRKNNPPSDYGADIREQNRSVDRDEVYTED